MLKVIPIPAFKDNYIWLILNPANSNCIVIDPGEADPVLDVLKKQNLTLNAILITHHHHDHTGGIKKLREEFPDVVVYGPVNDAVDGVDHKFRENDSVNFESLGLQLTAIDIPGHTKGHIAYYGDGMLFSGDTLFGAGCGRLFEGTAAQMYDSLCKLQRLPDTTRVYCGHEYTLANLRFAEAVEPDNIEIKKRMQKVAELRANNLPSLPSVLQLESLTNPFLRCHINSVIDSVNKHLTTNLSKPADVFQAVRAWKDTF